MHSRMLIFVSALLAVPAANAAVLAQVNDATYGAKIREHTTEERFLSPLVDHLPASETVPSPLDHFGAIIGAPDILHNTTEIYGYMRALAQTSPRVVVRSIGRTEENREMIEVIVADEASVRDLERYRSYLNQLADPRTLSEREAPRVITDAKPIYWLSGGLHSPETGAPEMLMELAYRLAVEETPFIRTIRDNMIVIIVPVAEPDGRDRMVDSYRYGKAHRDVGPNLTYWGKYVAHDNNRDGYGLGLALTRNVLASFFHWKPTVMHDLHESANILYVSTGTGPYNEQVDALTIDEWHNIAHEEVTQLTKFGMPGVWTHSFYTGWAANYLLWIPNTRNSIGRFYETLGNGGADTRERELSENATARQWYRPNPPPKKFTWSLRNNTNYMQSGVLVALRYVASRPQEFLENFYLKGTRAIERGRTEAPYAWVIPAQQRRSLGAVYLVNLLRDQGIEVHVATSDLKWSAAGEDMTAPRGSYVIRMDQPYRTLVQVLLDKQTFPPGEQPPYDDVGWTLPLLHQVDALAVPDSTILEAGMRLLSGPAALSGRLTNRNRDFFLVNNTTDDNFTVLRFQLADVRFEAAETPFEADGQEYAAGSFVIPVEGNPVDLADRLEEAARRLGLEVAGSDGRPDVPTHEIEVPRVALVHTWVATPQDAGWWRMAFDKIGIPYSYLSEQDLGVEDLTRFDVIIMPNNRASPQTLVAGTTDVGEPLPWRQTDEYSAIGIIDQTDDQRKGMGYDGVKNLRAFVERGGVFITEGRTAAFPIDMAITRRVSIQQTRQLVARGSVFHTTVVDAASPIVYGFPDSIAAYFSQDPVFQVDTSDGGNRNPDWFRGELREKEIPRVVLNFAEKDVLLSGMLQGESEIAGTPAIVDAPVGNGHVVLFAIHPFWRMETFGSHAFVFNTILHWNDLRAGWPKRSQDEEASDSR